MSAEQQSTIIYTLTDEAPLLATYAFLPIIQTFAGPAGIDVKTSDISVAARILAEFPEKLTDAQKVPDNLGELGKLTQDPSTNIIKLPNISASVPQLKAAVKELGGTGRRHDWATSRRIRDAVWPLPLFLAGGLHADNVGEAIRRVQPHGLDLCSRVRTDGRLDAAKLHAFMAAVRQA